MKVLHVTNLYPYPDNPIYGIFVKEQVDSLNKIGIETEVVFINAQGKGRKAYFTSGQLIRKKAREFDIVHCHHSYSSMVTLAIARVKKPVVTSFLNVLGGEGRIGFIEKIINKRILADSSAIIVKSDPEISSKLPNLGHYVPNGVNMDFFRPINEKVAFERIGVKPGNYILFVSGDNKHRRQKRYDIYSKVIEILNEEHNANVEELCMVKAKRELVPYYFNASKVHLLTSDFEGSPNSVKEALACNVPVVSTDVGNVRSMIGDAEGCFVGPDNEPKALAKRVLAAMKASDSFNGREILLRRELGMMNVARKIESIYKELLEIN